jgi:prepilin-type N-terminal cleavage/methylation domain-containing protein/prepilin-type processing-associated H-X9-DG protein
MRTCRGFTLVELLVVIGIIALLVGILLPVLSSARSSGIDVVCKNNLRQMHAAQFFYAEDHGSLTGFDRQSSNAQQWLWQLVPYLDSGLTEEDAYDERDTKGVPKPLWCPAEPYNQFPGDYFTYGINSFIMLPNWDFKTTVANAVNGPTELILMADKTLGGNDGEKQFVLSEDGVTLSRLPDGDGWLYGLNISELHSSFGAFRHTRGSKPTRDAWDLDKLQGEISGGNDVNGLNAVFLDGHVKSVKRSQMWLRSPHWHPSDTDLPNLPLNAFFSTPCCR